MSDLMIDSNGDLAQGGQIVTGAEYILQVIRDIAHDAFIKKQVSHAGSTWTVEHYVINSINQDDASIQRNMRTLETLFRDEVIRRGVQIRRESLTLTGEAVDGIMQIQISITDPNSGRNISDVMTLSVRGGAISNWWYGSELPITQLDPANNPFGATQTIWETFHGNPPSKKPVTRSAVQIAGNPADATKQAIYNALTPDPQFPNDPTRKILVTQTMDPRPATDPTKYYLAYRPVTDSAKLYRQKDMIDSPTADYEYNEDVVIELQFPDRVNGSAAISLKGSGTKGNAVIGIDRILLKTQSRTVVEYEVLEESATTDDLTGVEVDRLTVPLLSPAIQTMNDNGTYILMVRPTTYEFHGAGNAVVRMINGVPRIQHYVYDSVTGLNRQTTYVFDSGNLIGLTDSEVSDIITRLTTNVNTNVKSKYIVIYPEIVLTVKYSYGQVVQILTDPPSDAYNPERDTKASPFSTYRQNRYVKVPRQNTVFVIRYEAFVEVPQSAVRSLN